MSSFKRQKQLAWEYYKAWSKEITFCMQLKSKVRISREGWNHITKGSKSRNRMLKDKMSRIILLKAAKHIIKNPSKVIQTKRNSNNYYELSGNFVEKGRNIVVKVILKRDKAGLLHFYSVMRTKSRLSQT